MEETVKISRRVFLGGTVMAPLAACSMLALGQEKEKDANNSTPGRLIPWIFAGNPLERYMADYRRTFDAWSDGGVRGLAFGYMRFQQQNGSLSTYQADPAIYKAFGVDPPRKSERDPEKEKQLQAMMDDAAGRGWEVLIFGIGQQGGSRPLKDDPFGVVGFAASVQDCMNAYPQAQGIIIDGPVEHGYEPFEFHNSYTFGIREDQKPRLVESGVDMARFERGMNHLRDRFHNLTPSLVRYHSPAGVLDGLSLFDIDEDTLYWLRQCKDYSIRYMAALKGQIDKLNRKVKLGGILRAPTFSMLTTQDYHLLHPYFDYVFPKHYFWNRGFDGMYGTVARWVQNIQEWNPGLTEEDCFAVVKAWFGIELPGIQTLQDMEMGFPDEFFNKVVFQETRRALEAVGDDNKVIAWVSTGRSPHGGDPMTGHDLYRILVASQNAGLKRFIFHPDPDPSVPEWNVISGLCGKRWKEEPGGYLPPGSKLKF
jgi:hypothetical protein